MINVQHSTAVNAADVEEIRALFLRQAAGETAHDIDVIDAVLARALPGQPDPVNFVARAYRFWGREAVIDHFRTVFTGTWRFEPDEEAIRVMPLGPDVAHIYAPTRITAVRLTRKRRPTPFWSTNSRSAPPKAGASRPSFPSRRSDRHHQQQA